MRALKAKDDASGVAEIVLPGAGAGGETKGEGVRRIESGLQIVDLGGAKRDVPSKTDINAAAEIHGKSAGARHSCG